MGDRPCPMHHHFCPGELLAISCALCTYGVVTICIGASVPRQTLLKDYYILSDVVKHWWPGSIVVTIGIIASTTSSALASIQSASRLLQVSIS